MPVATRSASCCGGNLTSFGPVRAAISGPSCNRAVSVNSALVFLIRNVVSGVEGAVWTEGTSTRFTPAGAGMIRLLAPATAALKPDATAGGAETTAGGVATRVGVSEPIRDRIPCPVTIVDGGLRGTRAGASEAGVAGASWSVRGWSV
jgi:hypothetical protein